MVFGTISSGSNPDGSTKYMLLYFYYMGGEMGQEKFLTVFAVFDDETQKILKEYQNSVLSLGYEGTQTMDIPFHISLGTYSVSEENKMKEKIHEVCKKYKSFDNRFGYKVLFVEPKLNKGLKSLHNIFNHRVFDDGLSWCPHVTIFMGEEEHVKITDKYLSSLFKPIKAKVVGLQMGEFFPTRMIISEKLQK